MSILDYLSIFTGASTFTTVEGYHPRHVHLDRPYGWHDLLVVQASVRITTTTTTTTYTTLHRVPQCQSPLHPSLPHHPPSYRSCPYPFLPLAHLNNVGYYDGDPIDGGIHRPFHGHTHLIGHIGHGPSHHHPSGACPPLPHRLPPFPTIGPRPSPLFAGGARPFGFRFLP